jgi:uncharacterized membrane protein
MELARFWRHVSMSPARARACFPPSTLDAIEREVKEQERGHRGELCFVVEVELTTWQLWHEVDSRARARQVFALQGVWNTEENNGVLIYVLLADRRVEIVADRGIDSKVGPEDWQRICRAMEEHFGAGRYEEGSLAGVRAVSALLAREFHADGARRNELGDRPIMM